MNKMIRRICSWWQARTSRNRIYRAYPNMRDLDRQLAEARRSHKPGAARIIRAKKDAMTAALRGGA